jgi:hypothetical protein
VAFGDVVLAIGSVVRPWADLRAIRVTQVDLVKAIADQKGDIAATLASVEALASDLSQMKARLAEQDETLCKLRAAIKDVAPSAGSSDEIAVDGRSPAR